MKKTFGSLVLALVFFSCTSDNDMKYKEGDDAEHKDAKSENSAGGIDNVNGGIPDTTNTINIGTHNAEQDSSAVRDSTK